MAKHKSGYAAVDSAIDRAQQDHAAKQADDAVKPETSLESPARSMTPKEMEGGWTDEQAGRIADAAMNGDRVEKKARKKPDRSNPPYYKVYSEKPDFSDKKLEQRCDTAGKALKYIYGHSIEMAKADRVMFMVRCKALTMSDLMAE